VEVVYTDQDVSLIVRDTGVGIPNTGRQYPLTLYVPH
jgi:hypothetical protein